MNEQSTQAEYKYLSDGRKVSVVGKLNTQETIVQEIFVTQEGTEIPSGENFVVSSLHDSLVRSWKDKDEERKEQALKSLDTDIATMERKSKIAKTEMQTLQAMLRSSKGLSAAADLMEPNDFDLLLSFLSGAIAFVVVDSWEITKPQTLEEAIVRTGDSCYGENLHFDSLRLASVFGCSDGSLVYRINQYRDGSGSNTEIHPFHNLPDAMAHIKARAGKMLDDGRMGERSYKVCAEMGITFSKARQAKYKKNRLKGVLTRKKELQADLKKCEGEVDRIKAENS